MRLIQDRPEVTEEEKEALFSLIPFREFPSLEIKFYPTGRLDGVLVLRGEVSADISDFDPMMTGEPILEICATRPGDPKAEHTARCLNTYLRELWAVLEAVEVNRRRQKRGLPPLNFLVTQRAGKKQKVEPFSKRWGLSGASISSGKVYRGLGAYLGFEVVQARELSSPGETLAHRLQIAREFSDRFAFIHIHHKGPDEAAHKKDPRLKKEVIEALDQALKPFMDWLLGGEHLVVMTSDYATPSGGPLIHSGEPVPVVSYGPGVWRDEVRRFDEISCASGALGRIEGRDFMYLVLNFLDRACLKGLRYGPVERPYFPSQGKPLSLEDS